MLEPKFTYNDRIVSRLVKIEANKTSIQLLDISNSIKAKLQLGAKANDIFYLSLILGLEIENKEAERIVTGSQVDIKDERAQILKNFKLVKEFTHSTSVDGYAEIDTPILLQINKMLNNSIHKLDDLNFRSVYTENTPDKYDDWYELKNKGIESPERELGNLIDWYNNSTTTVTPLIRAAVLFYKLLDISPYNYGNKVTTIALVDYLLYKAGLSLKTYTSFTKNVYANLPRFVEGIRLSRNSNDMAPFVEVFLDTLNKDLLDIKESVSELLMEDEKSKKQPFLDLNPRQLKVLRYLQTVPSIKREDYCHMMEVSTMTAFRDLNDLVDKNLLKIEGQGRGTKYRLSSM
jgi:Fic family protein